MKKLIILIIITTIFSCNLKEKKEVNKEVEIIKAEKLENIPEIEEDEIILPLEIDNYLMENEMTKDDIELIIPILNNKILEIKLKDKSIYYSNISEKILTIKDILRFYYKEIVEEIDSSISFSNVDINKFKITDEELILGENEIILPYEKYIRIFKANTGIPSLYTKDKIIVKEIKNIDENKKHIAFTFDDGPVNEYHIKIRELFDEIGENATFCVVGQQVMKNSDMLIETYKNGHEIVNHSFSHKNLQKLNRKEILDEIIKSEDVIIKEIGKEVILFRPPYGSFNDETKKIIRTPLVLWDIDSLDWKTRNKEMIINEVMLNLKNDSVVLFHDLYETTYEAVKELIPILKEKNYQFVTYSSLKEYKKKKREELKKQKEIKQEEIKQEESNEKK